MTEPKKDPRREPSSPQWTAEVTGKRRIELERRVKSVPDVPSPEKRKEPTAFFDYLRDIEIGRRERDIEILLQGEMRALFEEEQRKIRIAERDEMMRRIEDVQAISVQQQELNHRQSEALTALASRFDAFEKRMGRFESQQTEIIEQIRSVGNEVGGLGERVRDQGGTLADFGHRLAQLEEEFEKLKGAFWADVRARAKGNDAGAEDDSTGKPSGEGSEDTTG